MKISRRGTYADFGTSSISLSKPKFDWAAEKFQLSIKDTAVSDFSTGSTHNYDIQIRSDEIVQILSVLAKAALSNPTLFEEKLGDALKSVTQLQAVLSGIVQA